MLYHNILQSGFNEYPEIDYFKASLIQYYHNIKDYGNALTVIEQCLENDSLNVKYLKLKGNELLSMNKPQIAKTVYLSIIDLDPYDYDTASILGNIFLEEAHVFYASKNLSIDSPDYLKNRNYLIDLYSQAQQYYEIALKLRPQQPELWKNGLMEIYLRLNKGEDLRKIESL